MNKIQDDILSYREMCDTENVQTLQRGMNFRINPFYSLILMSQRSNAPYNDRVYADGITIEYEGHDVSRKDYYHNPKNEDQQSTNPTGTFTQNGKFIKAVEDFKNNLRESELVKVYEKVVDGVWSLKGYFDLIDYKIFHDGNRNVYRFILRLSNKKIQEDSVRDIELIHSRIIPTSVKVEVWKRDKGICVKCGSIQNLHYDHDLPFSKGGTSLTAKNVRLLCMKHNLQKSAKIE